jgi:type II secretory pathway component GspD/PulD (secretin)
MPLGPNPGWRLTVDTRTNSLIVPGTERDLRTAGQYLTALDSREGNAASGVKDFRVFKLKYAEAQQVAAILSELDLNVNVASLPKARTLAITGPESALKEVAEVIEAVDVTSEELKPPPGDARR